MFCNSLEMARGTEANVCEEDVPTSAYTLTVQSSQSRSDFHQLSETLCFCCRCWSCLRDINTARSEDHYKLVRQMYGVYDNFLFFKPQHFLSIGNSLSILTTRSTHIVIILGHQPHRWSNLKAW